VQGFAGQWRLAVSEARGRQIIEQAIERGTEDMFFVVRGIARGKLRDKNRLSPTLGFAFRGERVSITYEGSFTYASTLGGAPVRVTTPDGETASVSHRVRNGRIVQIFRNEDGVRTNHFALAENGSRLAMGVVIRSDQLPDHVRYRLPYRRASR